MSQIGPITSSGQGVYDFGLNLYPAQLNYVVQTLGPSVDVLGTGPIDRLYKAGWMGTGYLATEVPIGGDVLGFWTWIEWMGGDIGMPSNTDAARHMFFSFSPGTSVKWILYY